MLKCHEVVADADRLLADELAGRKRFAINMHLLICRDCRRYIRQLRALLSAIPNMHDKASEQEVTAIMDNIKAHSDS